MLNQYFRHLPQSDGLDAWGEREAFRPGIDDKTAGRPDILPGLMKTPVDAGRAAAFDLDGPSESLFLSEGDSGSR